MRKFTSAYVTAVAAIAVHAVAFFFGAPGIVVAVAASMTFCLVAWMFYRRGLKRLHREMRGLSYEERMAIYTVTGIDAEAQRDLDEIDRIEGRGSEARDTEQRSTSALRAVPSERFPKK